MSVPQQIAEQSSDNQASVDLDHILNKAKMGVCLEHLPGTLAHHTLEMD